MKLRESLMLSVTVFNASSFLGSPSSSNHNSQFVNLSAVDGHLHCQRKSSDSRWPPVAALLHLCFAAAASVVLVVVVVAVSVAVAVGRSGNWQTGMAARALAADWHCCGCWWWHAELWSWKRN